MKVENSNVKRYAVYVFYDKQGIADRYHDYFLQGLKKETTFLQVVVNGNICPESLARFRAIADDVMIRPNEGYDVTAYKEGLLKPGMKKLSEYDEVIICNDTMYGPLYPLSEMFDVMNKKDVDFWGLTNFHGAPFDPFGTIEYGYIPKHVQSFFMVFRKSLVSSVVFQSFWGKFPKVNGYEEAIGLFEATFTKRFEDHGFKWAVYADSSDLEGYTLDPLRDFPRYMLEEKRCPFMKKRTFYHEYGEAMDRSGGEGAKEAFEFIRDELEYPEDLIWENLIRTQNMADIKKRLQLNYVVSSRYAKKRKQSLKLALFLHIYYDDLADYCRRYAENMPEGTDVFITVPDEKKLASVKKAFEGFPYKTEYRVTGNRGRDVAPFVVGCKDVVANYDLIIKMHDKKVYQIKPMSLGESWAYKCFEILQGSKTVVNNIIALFEENPRLGILCPPVPNHGPYFPTIGKGEWGENFPITKEIADMLGLSVDLNENKEPIAALGSMFWARPKALAPLFAHDWQYEEMPKEPIYIDSTILHGIERVYPFCAQEAGFYSANVMTSRFAPIELNSLQFFNEGLIKAEYEMVGKMPLRQMLEAVKQR